MEYSDDQVREFALRMAWEMIDEEQKEQLLAMARASLKVTDAMGVNWIIDKMEPPDNEQ